MDKIKLKVMSILFLKYTYNIPFGKGNCFKLFSHRYSVNRPLRINKKWLAAIIEYHNKSHGANLAKIEKASTCLASIYEFLFIQDGVQNGRRGNRLVKVKTLCELVNFSSIIFCKNIFQVV